MFIFKNVGPTTKICAGNAHFGCTYYVWPTLVARKYVPLTSALKKMRLGIVCLLFRDHVQFFLQVKSSFKCNKTQKLHFLNIHTSKSTNKVKSKVGPLKKLSKTSSKIICLC